MNDPLLAIAKLRDIAHVITKSETEVERAALYSAARWLLHDLEAEIDEGEVYAREQIVKARWHIAAALGYDITNGHEQSQHLSSALGSLGVLESLLSER